MEEKKKKKKQLPPSTTTNDGDDGDDAISLSDLPVAPAVGAKPISPNVNDDHHRPEDTKEFEFHTRTHVGLCAADDVFFEGRILPLRPSISSDAGLPYCASRSGSISTSRSSSTSSSSMSRSRKCSINGNNFYTHPSPSPQLRRAKTCNASRKSTSSEPAGWRLIRIGVDRAPEIELQSLRARRTVRNPSDGKCGNLEGDKVKAKLEKKGGGSFRVFGLGFGCKCSPESVGEKETRVLVSRKKEEMVEEEVVMRLRRGGSMRQRRMFEWLEELSVTKVVVN